ncbi:MAG: phosphoribosyltransferase family protein [Anaerolineaceae bacterium]
MQQIRRELLTWEDVDKLIDHLLTQFNAEYEVMLMISRGGIIPGGMLAEALHILNIFTASVDFPPEMADRNSRLLTWPKFLQFPEDRLLTGKRVLIVDDVWGSGRTLTSVRNRVSGTGGLPHTCVLHFNPYRNLFEKCRPDYYGAITDAYIIYPWEIHRGQEGILLDPC